MIADRLLWWLILGYPILFAIADNRSVYSDRSVDVSSNPLGSAGLIIQLAALVLAAGLMATRLMNDARSHWPLPSVLPYLGIFFITAAAISLAKGELGPAFGALVACVTLAAVSLTPTSPVSVLGHVRGFLRLQVLASVALGILLPLWALVPPEHNSRTFFGVDSRLIGLTSGPNYMGATAAVLFILELFVLTRGRLLRAVFATLALVAVVWSQSRTGLGVIALTSLLALMARLLHREGLLTLARLFVWGPIIVMATAPFAILAFIESRSELLASITTGRVYVWQAALDAVRAAPLFGLTHEEFAAIVQSYSSEYQFSNAHNQLLETMATGGIVMATLLLLLLTTLGKSLVLQARTQLAPLALSFGVLGQLPFGTPLRLTGFSWNLVAAAILVLCTRPWVAPDGLDAEVQPRERGGHRKGSASMSGGRNALGGRI